MCRSRASRSSSAAGHKCLRDLRLGETPASRTSANRKANALLRQSSLSLMPCAELVGRDRSLSSDWRAVAYPPQSRTSSVSSSQHAVPAPRRPIGENGAGRSTLKAGWCSGDKPVSSGHVRGCHHRPGRLGLTGPTQGPKLDCVLVAEASTGFPSRMSRVRGPCPAPVFLPPMSDYRVSARPCNSTSIDVARFVSGRSRSDRKQGLKGMARVIGSVGGAELHDALFVDVSVTVIINSGRVTSIPSSIRALIMAVRPATARSRVANASKT